jgi:preprotein translocase subunit YajC
MKENNGMHFILLMSPPQGGSQEGGLISTVVMFALIIGIFYFMILRPQQKRQKERQKLLEALKKGDKIVTAGGLHGTIAGLDEKTALIQVADNVKMKFERSAISTVVREGDGGEKKE